jgi:hypothetical protein
MYTLAGFYIRTHSSSLPCGRRRQYMDQEARAPFQETLVRTTSLSKNLAYVGWVVWVLKRFFTFCENELA